MAKVAGKQTKPAEQGRCRRTQPADDPTGTDLEATQQPADEVGRPRSKTPAADDVGRPLAMQCRLMEGVRWCWPLRRWAQTYIIVCLTPTYRLCLSPSLPTPLICTKPNLAPTYFFVFIFILHPTTIRPLTPFTVSVRLTYLVT